MFWISLFCCKVEEYYVGSCLIDKGVNSLFSPSFTSRFCVKHFKVNWSILIIAENTMKQSTPNWLLLLHVTVGETLYVMCLFNLVLYYTFSSCFKAIFYIGNLIYQNFLPHLEAKRWNWKHPLSICACCERDKK